MPMDLNNFEATVLGIATQVPKGWTKITGPMADIVPGLTQKNLGEMRNHIPGCSAEFKPSESAIILMRN